MSFDRLPKEITNKILVEHLEPRDWAVVAQVCKGWKGLIEPKSSPEEQQRLLALLINSTLWKDLDILQRRGNLSHYFSRLTQDKVRVRWLEEFIAYFWKHVHPDFSIASFSCAIPQTEQPLVEYAYRILNNIAIYNPQPDSLQKFFSFPPHCRIQQKETWRDYRKLENTLFAMSMLLQLTLELNQPVPNRSGLLKIICDATIHQWLHGKDIVELNKNFPWLIDDMLKESIKNITTPSVLTSDEKALIPTINDLLERLSADDWLVYLEFDIQLTDNDSIRQKNRVGTLEKAFQCNHFIIRNLNADILLKIVHNNYSSWRSLILQSSNAFGLLKDDDVFYEIASRLTLQAFIETAEINALFIPRFNFDLAKKYLDKANMGQNKFFLMNAEFLQHLTDKYEQIPSLAQYFLSLVDVKDTLQSSAFLDMLERMSIYNDKKTEEIRSLFLIRFAGARKIYIPEVIAENDTIRKMLTDDDIKKLSRLDRGAYKILINKGHRCLLEGNASDVYKPLPNSNQELTTKLALPIVSPKTTINEYKPTNSVNWKKRLTIAGFILLGLISIGLMAVGGVGAIIGIPLIIQAILIGIGVLSFTSVLFGSLSQSKQVEAVSESPLSFSSVEIHRELKRGTNPIIEDETSLSLRQHNKPIGHVSTLFLSCQRKLAPSNSPTVDNHHVPARFTRSQ